jgi:magnesium chelatase family protein
LKVARTIADLDGSDAVRRIHVAEALSLKRQWATPDQAGFARVS